MEVWSDRGRGSRQLHSFRWIPETVERPPLEVRPGSAAPPPPPRDVEAASTVRFPKLRVTCKRKILHRVNAQGTLGSTSAHLTDTNLLTNLIHDKKVQTRRRTSWGGSRGAPVPRSQSRAAAVRLPSLMRIARSLQRREQPTWFQIRGRPRGPSMLAEARPRLLWAPPPNNH